VLFSVFFSSFRHKYQYMKIWRIKLLTALLFFATVTVFIISSCEKNPCNNVTCFNGGSCNNGTCKCPVGWEGPQCSYLSVNRFIGGYVGTTICNAGARILDSAWIVGDAKNVNFVYITQKSQPSYELHGYVDNSTPTYTIIVPQVNSVNFLEYWTITLQNNTTLSIDRYNHDQTVVGDTIIEECNFLGTRFN